MKVVLVAVNAKYIHSCLAVHSLYTYLNKENENIDDAKNIVVKEFTINNSEDIIISELFALKPHVLAFSCYIWNINMVLSITRSLKIIMPEVKIIAGGPEVSYDWEGLAEHGIDFIVKGEGEKAFRTLIALLQNGEECEPVWDGQQIPLESIPFPYQDGFAEFENRIIYYESSRGCFNNCSFCLSGAGSKGLRFLPIERTKADLLAFILAKVAQVKFVDRTFNCDKERAKNIWAYLIQKDNGVTNFHFEISADLLDDEAVELLGQARKGLFQFEIGVQSTNPKTLAAVGRATDTRKLFENVRKLKLLGNICCYLDLIAGLPYEDYESFITSFNDVIACNPDKLHLGFLKLLKGSALRKNANQFGIKFKNVSPYEILTNNFMGFDVLDKLKNVEHVVGVFYNTGGFGGYVKFMMGQFKTPYDFFEALSTYWKINNCHLISHKKMALYTILYDFFRYSQNSRDSESSKLICELLRFDMLTKENIRTFPDWISEYYSYDAKKVTRTSAIHTFEYDIVTWLKQTGENSSIEIKRVNVEVEFYYEVSPIRWQLLEVI
ncbi:MAG: B12-binding domain-containing radical SAM protein [Defluviitaleaceae bacterium]|nr:B12-binding domain-containing radical SAM protein [Defluviitaleaceae bacterium]